MARAVSWLRVYWWVPLSIMGAVVFGYWTLPQAETVPPPIRAVSTSAARPDAANFRPGELNSDAVRTAREFDEFPLLWLGESFEGFQLMEVLRVNFFIPKEEIRASRDLAENDVSLVPGHRGRISDALQRPIHSQRDLFRLEWADQVIDHVECVG